MLRDTSEQIVTYVFGEDRLQWMHDHIQNVFEKSPAPWWLVASSFSIPVGLALLRTLQKTLAYRAPCPNKRVEDGEPEVIIVGGGVMGSSLAAALGMDGRRVTVIERDMTEPDRFVGEYLQSGGVATLKELLLEDCLEGIDSQHSRGYIIRDADSIKDGLVLPTPAEKVSPRSFHHGRFVQQLRKAAIERDSVTYLEGVVLEVLEEAGAVTGVRYRRKGSPDQQVLTAPLVVVADGIHSKFRKAYTKEGPKAVSHCCGVILPDVPLHNFLEEIVIDSHIIFLYKVSSNGTRVVVDLPTKGTTLPADLKGYLRDVVSPKMPVNLAAPFMKAVETGDVKVQTANWMPANPVKKPGIMVLGDALNIRHFLTGAGMTASLNDALLTRNMLRKISNLYDYSAVMRLYSQLLADRKQKTFTINIFAQSLFLLFKSEDAYIKRVKRGMLQYFARKGFRKNGVIGIMSILRPTPSYLMTHFILGILYGIVLNFKEEGILRFPVACCQGMVMLVKTFATFGPYIWDEIRTGF